MSTSTDEVSEMTTQSIDELMTASFALTHRIHAIDKLRTKHRKSSPEWDKCVTDAADLRAQRDIIVREIKRRAGEL